MNSPVTVVSGQHYFKGLEHSELWHAFKEQGDMHARHRLIELNEKLVYEMLKQVKRGNDNTEDLIAWGRLGLVKAIDRFDPNRGIKFSSFACILIKGEMKESQRRHYHPEEQFALDIDGPECAATPDRSPSVFETAVRAASQEYLRQCIAWLPQQEKTVIVLRFFFDVPVAEIGRHLNCNEKRVKQIRARAVQRMRRWLNSEQWTLYSNTPAPVPAPQLFTTKTTYVDSPLGKVRVHVGTNSRRKRGRKPKARTPQLISSRPARQFKLVCK